MNIIVFQNGLSAHALWTGQANRRGNHALAKLMPSVLCHCILHPLKMLSHLQSSGCQMTNYQFAAKVSKCMPFGAASLQRRCFSGTDSVRADSHNRASSGANFANGMSSIPKKDKEFVHVYRGQEAA